MRRSTQRPIAFVLASSNHGSMLVNRFDHHTEGERSFGVGIGILTNSSHDQGEIDTVIQLLDTRRKNFGDGVVAIDCGANIGTHTVEWAQHMYGWGEVVAIEAQERIFYALAGNITLNNCFNAYAIWSAVGKEKGSIRVPVPDYLSPGSFGSLEIRQRPNTEFIGQAIDYERTINTPMMCIDGLGLQRIDFIKIDVEGMELDVLAGARESIMQFKPQMLIERLKTDLSALEALLSDWDYKIFPMGINILAIHEDDPAWQLIQA